MLQCADLLLPLPNDQIVGREVKNLTQRIPIDEVRVLVQELFVVEWVDGFKRALTSTRSIDFALGQYLGRGHVTTHIGGMLPGGKVDKNR